MDSRIKSEQARLIPIKPAHQIECDASELNQHEFDRIELDVESDQTAFNEIEVGEVDLNEIELGESEFNQNEGAVSFFSFFSRTARQLAGYRMLRRA